MHPAGKRVAPYEAPKKAFRRFVLSAAVAGGSAASPQSRWTKKKKGDLTESHHKIRNSNISSILTVLHLSCDLSGS